MERLAAGFALRTDVPLPRPPLPNEPFYRYAMGEGERLAIAAVTAADGHATGELAGRFDTVRRETVAATANLADFVRRFGLTDRRSGPVFWCNYWIWRLAADDPEAAAALRAYLEPAHRVAPHGGPGIMTLPVESGAGPRWARTGNPVETVNTAMARLDDILDEYGGVQRAGQAMEKPAYPSEPGVVYVHGQWERLTAVPSGPDGAAKEIEIRQEIGSSTANLHRVVNGLGMTSRWSGPVRWTKAWTNYPTIASDAVVGRVLNPIAPADPRIADAIPLVVAQRIHEGALANDASIGFSGAALCRVRRWILSGEAAYRSGDLETARRRLTTAAAQAPHITLVHRRLGEIARRLGNAAAAAQHFEAACAVPNMPWIYADMHDAVPIPMGVIEGWVSFVRYRGSVYAVPSDGRSAGVLGLGKRLLVVPDTWVYRLWQKRVKPAVAVLRRYGRVVRSGLIRSFHAFGRVAVRTGRRAGRALALNARRTFAFRYLRAMKAWLFGEAAAKPKITGPSRPSRLRRFLRYARPRVKIAARVFRGLAQGVIIQVKLAILMLIFQARAVPDESRASSLSTLLDKLAHGRDATVRP